MVYTWPGTTQHTGTRYPLLYRNFPTWWNLHRHKFQFDSASLGTSALSEVLEQKLGLMDFCSIFAGFLGHS